MTDDREFARWLRDRLEERRISQRQLAHRSGVDHSTVSRLLKGGRRPTHQTAMRLTRALNGSRLDPAALATFLRGDPHLAEPDIARIVDLYTAIRARRRPEADSGRPQR